MGIENVADKCWVVRHPVRAFEASQRRRNEIYLEGKSLRSVDSASKSGKTRNAIIEVLHFAKR